MSLHAGALPSSLVVVSHVRHYLHQGRVYAYAPYARELDIWANIFAKITIAAPLVTSPPPGDCAMMAENVAVSPQRETGGHTLPAKLAQLLQLPLMVRDLWPVIRGAEAVHVRCPGNLGLLGVLLAPLCTRRVVAKYAGQWNGYEGEALTSRLTRWLLRSSWWPGPVTVYGEWKEQPAHVVPFFTSVLEEADRNRAAQCAAARSLAAPFSVLFVGRLSAAKGVDLVIRALAISERSVVGKLTIVGEGPERDALETLAHELDVSDGVWFVGGVSFAAVLDEYARHDIVVLLSETEGWPKVLAEAMAFGNVAIGMDTGFVSTMLGEGRGIALRERSPELLAAAWSRLASDPSSGRDVQRSGAAWASQYSLTELERALRELLITWWPADEASARHLNALPDTL